MYMSPHDNHSGLAMISTAAGWEVSETMPDSRGPETDMTVRTTASDVDPDVRPPTYEAALMRWTRHQADRAWINWGFCWPPVSIARPRCRECRASWPCDPTLAALQVLKGTE